MESDKRVVEVDLWLQKLVKTTVIYIYIYIGNVVCLINLVFFSYVIFEKAESEEGTYMARFSVHVTQS